MQNFRKLVASGAEVNVFDKTPKGTSLPNLTRFKPLIVQIRSRVFSRQAHEKWDTTKSHREVIFHLLSGNSPSNLIQLKWQMRRGHRRNQSHQVF